MMKKNTPAREDKFMLLQLRSSGSHRLLDVMLPPVGCVRHGSALGFWAALAAEYWAMLQALEGNFFLAVAVAALTRFAFFFAVRYWPLGQSKKYMVLSERVVTSTMLYFAVLLILCVGKTSPELQGAISIFPAASGLFELVTGGIDAFVDWLTSSFSGEFMVVTRAMNALLNSLEYVLGTIPWPIGVLLIVFVVWRKGGVAPAIFTLLAMLYIGFFGFWEKMVATSALVLAAFLVCLVLGIPLGIAAAKSRTLKSCIMPCLDVMQTMPSFVYLLPAVAFFSIGKPPALVATVIFAMPPLIRLTCLGLDQVPLSVKEAMYAHGATTMQTLLKAELPLAGPSIHAGINQSIMMSLSMVVIAALIGGGGLGYDVLFALQNVQYGRGILAGLAIVFCAIVFDRLMRPTRASAKKDSNKH